MPFIQVKNTRRNPHGLQGTHATDTQQQFLADAHAPIPTIQAGSQFPVFRSVSWHIGVKKEKIAAADFQPPHLGAKKAAAGIDFHRHRFARLPNGNFHGQLADVGLKILFPLPTVLVQALQEVALPVEQADADEGNAQVGCTLDVVSREDTQSAGINWQ